MSAKWDVRPLGELAVLTKGASPTEKTPPGAYPLVVTAEEPRTSLTYQFDGEAVCIPTISSTGHGHASLKRIHYANGRFALANLLVAAQVKPGVPVMTKYLHLYLSVNKDRLLVPLMQGTANVNMRLADLAGVPVSYPDVAMQRRMVDVIGYADDAVASSQRYVAAIDTVATSLLRESEAGGDKTCQIGDLVTKAKAGATPNRSTPAFYGGDIPWLKSGEVDQDGIGATSETITAEGLRASSAWLIPEGSIVVAMYGQGQTAGSVGYLATSMASNQAVLALVPNPEVVDGRFLFHALRSRKEVLRQKRTGSTQPNLNKAIVLTQALRVPPLPEQRRIAVILDEAYALRDATVEKTRRLAHLRAALALDLVSGRAQIGVRYDKFLVTS